MKTKLVLFVLLAICLTACGEAADVIDDASCTRSEYLDLVGPKLEEWDDAAAIAGSTSRISLAPQVTRLQEIKRDVDNMNVPLCAILAHMDLVRYMEGNIDAYLAFMSQEDEDEITQLFKEANEYLDDWSEAVAEIDE